MDSVSRDAGPEGVVETDQRRTANQGTLAPQPDERKHTGGGVAVRDFIAGFLIGTSIWTPLFVATAAEETPWQQYGLPGGLAMFTAGIWLRFGATFGRRGAALAKRKTDGGQSSGSGMGTFAL